MIQNGIRKKRRISIMAHGIRVTPSAGTAVVIIDEPDQVEGRHGFRCERVPLKINGCRTVQIQRSLLLHGFRDPDRTEAFIECAFSLTDQRDQGRLLGGGMKPDGQLKINGRCPVLLRCRQAGAKEGHERIGVLVGGITGPEAADIFNHVAEGNQLMTAEIGLPFRVFFIIADMAPRAGCLGQPVACQGKANLIGINGELAAQRLFTAGGIAQGRGQGNQRLGCKQCLCPGQFRLDSTCIFHDMPEIKIQVIREDQIGEKLRDGDKRSLRFRCGMRDGGQGSSLAKG